MNPQLGLCLALGVVATAEDLWRRQISNWIPVTGLVAGLGWHWFVDGWWGVLMSLAGAALGFGIFMIRHLLTDMGGGDVKLMAAFGALLGWRGVFYASLWAMAAGGVLALAAFAGRRLWRWFARRVLSRPVSGPLDDSIPLAPALSLGALLGWASISLV